MVDEKDLVMNRVTVSLVPFGPYVLDFRTGVNDYIGVINAVRERLVRMGYDHDTKIYVNVR